MKRVRCPKCEAYIQFDETKYKHGQSLVFVCPECKKQFGIRLGTSKLSAANQTSEQVNENEGIHDYGNLLVIENVFGFKQVLPLQLGDNIIGRKNKGSNIDLPIETNDPSMDRAHCILNVTRNKQGKIIYTLRDNNSTTGTFVMNQLLSVREKRMITDGNTFTLGATSIILREAEHGNDEE